MIGQHLMLKAVAFGVTTPFFSASLVETVQSDIACEKPGVFDIFKVRSSLFFGAACNYRTVTCKLKY